MARSIGSTILAPPLPNSVFCNEMQIFFTIIEAGQMRRGIVTVNVNVKANGNGNGMNVFVNESVIQS